MGPIPFDRVIRTNNAELIASGLADRFEKGSLLWWNPDYVHYQFQDRHPDYDYYVFVEYDAVIYGGIAPLIQRAAALHADLVTLPIRTPVEDWYWAIFHQQTYPLAELRGALNCMAVFSSRALGMLGRRRREMATNGQSLYWPSSEAFIPTEIGRAGYSCHSLAEFGDVSGYDWFPPLLEEDLPAVSGAAFFSPGARSPALHRIDVEIDQGSCAASSIRTARCDAGSPGFRAKTICRCSQPQHATGSRRI